MPVDDRLRRGLEANARAIVPEAEKRLAEVHRQHRRHTTRIGVAAAAAVVALAVAAGSAGSLLGGSGGDDTPRPAPQPTQATSSSDAYTGPRIPDSGWRKVVTREQLVRAGADRAFLAENLGDTDRLPVILSFVGEVYSQSARYPGSWSVGDAGTLSYDADGRLVLTSTSPGCRGCTASLSWRIQGDRLRLGFSASPSDPMTAVMLEGVWTRIRS